MGRRQQAADRAVRPKLRSPGHSGLLQVWLTFEMAGPWGRLEGCQCV